MPFLDFLMGGGGGNNLFNFQPQNAPQAMPWQNPDAMPKYQPMQGMQGQPMPGQQPAPMQLNPGYGQSMPWKNPDMQQNPMAQQENLRRMMYMQQLMSQPGQGGQQQQGQQPMPQAPQSMPMGGGQMQPLAGRMNAQAMTPQMQQRPIFMQPRAGRFLGRGAVSSLGQ